METNLQKIKKLSEQKHEENWRFRALLKGCPSAHIDTLVHQFYQEVSSHIDCTACANCCKELQPNLEQEDIERLAQELDMSAARFTEQYLMEDIQDRIREGQKPNFISRLWGVIDNYALCPIVFNVYELLKKEWY